MAGNKKTMRVGLGEAIKRVLFLSAKRFNDIASKSEREELELLMNALNTIPLDLGFDCNEDDVPDTIEIFTQSAATSCCRLVDLDEVDSKASKPSKTTSKSKTKTKVRKINTDRGSRG